MYIVVDVLMIIDVKLTLLAQNTHFKFTLDNHCHFLIISTYTEQHTLNNWTLKCISQNIHTHSLASSTHGW